MITLSTPGLFSRYLVTISTAELATFTKELAPINLRCGIGDVFVFTHLMILNRSDAVIGGAQVNCNSLQISTRRDVESDPLYTYFGFNGSDPFNWSPQGWPQNWSFDWGTWTGGTTGQAYLMIYGNWINPRTFGLPV